MIGASFCNPDQIIALAEFDSLTIAPILLNELSKDYSQLAGVHLRDQKGEMTEPPMDEATFRWRRNGAAMATEKLAEGILNFDMDHQKLVTFIPARMT